VNRRAWPLGLAFVAFTNVAGAASRIVVIDDSDRTTREATARLRGELAAAGFEVEARAHTGDARSDVESSGGTEVATVRLVRDPQTRATELWVSDRLTGKTLVRRVRADPERSPRLVALRGVELLRASLLELASPPHDDAPPATPEMAQPPPPEVVRLVAPPPAVPLAPVARDVGTSAPSARPWIPHAAFDAGIAVLASTDHLGPAATPAFGAWVALPASLALRLRFVGPAFQSGLSNAIGSAVVRQECGSLDLAWIVPLRGWLAPYVALGGGAYHLHVQGTASAPYHGTTNDVWAALAAGAAGVAFRIAPGVSIAAEGRLLGLAPHPAVTIGGDRVASAGDPSLLASASLVASF
jgi:hypothetical protein